MRDGLLPLSWMLFSSKDHPWITEPVWWACGDGRGGGLCPVDTEWTHGHSAVDRDRGNLLCAHFKLVYLGLCAVFVSASRVSPLLPFLFPVVSPLSSCRAFCLLSCLFFWREPLTLVIMWLVKSPLGTWPLSLSGCGEKLQKSCRQWSTMTRCCCRQFKGWSCCLWVKMWFCGFMCTFQSEGLLESAHKNFAQRVLSGSCLL